MKEQVEVAADMFLILINQVELVELELLQQLVLLELQIQMVQRVSRCPLAQNAQPVTKWCTAAILRPSRLQVTG